MRQRSVEMADVSSFSRLRTCHSIWEMLEPGVPGGQGVCGGKCAEVPGVEEVCVWVCVCVWGEYEGCTHGAGV